MSRAAERASAASLSPALGVGDHVVSHRRSDSDLSSAEAVDLPFARDDEQPVVGREQRGRRAVDCGLPSDLASRRFQRQVDGQHFIAVAARRAASRP